MDSTRFSKQSKFKKYMVDIKDYEIRSQIESGGFGCVYQVQNKTTGVFSAAKVINKHRDESQYKLMINREIGIMIRCQHPTIINFFGYSLKDFSDQNNVTIFMQLAEKGSLSDVLQKIQKGLLNDNYDNTTRQIILIGIARGMMYLHQHRILHRDLKPGNILLDSNFYPHITDFGLSKSYEQNNSMSQSQQYGTSIYMAPEVIESTNYNWKADVYSFGILMYEVVTDMDPYPILSKGKMSFYTFTQKVVNENMRPKFDIPLKPSIQKLIEKCWSKNPRERPTFEEIFKKLAYNIDSSDDDIYEGSNEEEEEDGYKYYLDDVDVDEILFYADEIDGKEEQKKVDASKESDIEKIIREAVKAEMIKIESQINPIIAANEEMKEEIESIRKENERLKKKYEEEMTAKIDSIKKENEEMKEEICSIQKANKYLKKKYEEEMTAKISSIKKENEEMKEEILSTREENEYLKKKFEEEKEEMKKKIEIVESENAVLKNNYEEMKNRLTSLENNFNDLNKANPSEDNEKSPKEEVKKRKIHYKKHHKKDTPNDKPLSNSSEFLETTLSSNKNQSAQEKENEKEKGDKPPPKKEPVASSKGLSFREKLLLAQQGREVSQPSPKPESSEDEDAKAEPRRNSLADKMRAFQAPKEDEDKPPPKKEPVASSKGLSFREKLLLAQGIYPHPSPKLDAE